MLRLLDSRAHTYTHRLLGVGLMDTRAVVKPIVPAEGVEMAGEQDDGSKTKREKGKDFSKSTGTDRQSNRAKMAGWKSGTAGVTACAKVP